MRHLMALMFLVIFCSLQLTSSAPEASNAAKSKCCVKFSNAMIPLRLVKSYYRTDSSCPKPAIVFQTDKRVVCVDPETSWVSNHIAKIDKITIRATTQTNTRLFQEPDFTTYNTETNTDNHYIAKKDNMRTITTATTQTNTRLFQEPDFTTENIKGDKLKMCLAPKI
ncbi:C-C motif chemokine 2-like isoform X2 [Paramisgurnus dabryanus]|uniref:C-C motif chemokine 2-like isoform X2 n=1 Tax=Paramisgurnus dabryanus TaxID=90735 RepID=UPI0031F3F5F8